ncbi:MAG TPA: protein phosphatase 2C domain-containing protein [Ktedonobacteraceae bacterium]
MRCPSCYTQNRETARFCKVCGYRLDEGVQAETARTTPPQFPAVQTPSTGADNNIAPLQQADQKTQQEGPPPPAEIPGNETWPSGDLSQAPTQILTPQEMMKFHKKQWNTEVQNNQPDSQQPHDVTDLPTVIWPSNQEQPKSEYSWSESDDVRELPTASTEPQQPSGEDAATPPDATSAGEGQSDLPEPVAASPQNEQPSSGDTASEQGTAPGSGSDFPVLSAGAFLGNNRYEVTQILDEAGHEHTHQVIDHQGYQHCWNCGSEENSEGDEFCIDCGARLLDAQYIVHEYPSSEPPDSDAHVLTGTIINTFVENEHTYVIEQPSVVQETFPNGVHLLAASDSDAGDLRRGEPNEDSTLVLQFERIHESVSTPGGIFVVADGMGGHDNGQLASRMVISMIAKHCIRDLILPPLEAEQEDKAAEEHDEDSYVALVREAIEDANSVLCQVNQREKTDMGSTLTGFMIVGNHAYIFNVGDSRTYMLREGNLYQLTTDHSLVGQLVAGGMIEPDEVYTHPQRNQIFRSIGDKPNVQIDVFKQQIHPGDILLSCCDGLWEMVRNPQITDILNKIPDPQAACAQLIEAANANGGEDNISAVVVYVR